MAKRELSSTLKNLKFMQRGAPKEKPKEEEDNPKLEESFGPTSTIKRKCIVIMEGNPHPGAVKGRMSFLNFNPSIDKLNQEAGESSEPGKSSAHSQQAETSNREMQSETMRSTDTNMAELNGEPDVNHKRKQPLDVEPPSPNSQKKSGEWDEQLSTAKNFKSFSKQRKQEKLDWNVLRRAKIEAKRA